MPSWITAPIAAALALLFFIGFAVQTVRVDGFPIFYTGLRTQLAECEAANGRAQDAERKEVDRIRAEGKVAADADTARLRKEAADREKGLSDQLVGIGKIVANLRVRPSPVVIQGQPTVTVAAPPPLPAVCELDRGALDALRTTLNVGRAP